MWDLQLRRLKDAICFPLVRVLGRLLTPNQLTVAAFVTGMLSVVCLTQGHYHLGHLLWWLNRILDGLDGAVARLTNRQTDLGGYLDVVLDFTVYALLPIGLTCSHHGVAAAASAHLWSAEAPDGPCALSPDQRWELMALALLEASYFVNAASLLMLASMLEKRALGAKRTGQLTSIAMPPGLIEGAETLVAYTLFMLSPRRHLVWLFASFGTLVWVTVMQRMLWAYRNL